MQLEEYLDLMSSVSEFGMNAGLNTQDLYSKTLQNETLNLWVISVSHKTSLDNYGILYSPRDEYKPNFNRQLTLPVIPAPLEQIEKYKARALEVDAEYFCKKCIASGGKVELSSDFLKLSKVEQVEYALHEAFHATSKQFFGRKVEQLSFEYEEGSALIVGYLGAVNYFRNTNLAEDAERHWQKHFTLARKVNKFVGELEEIYAFRVGEDQRPVPQEQKLREKEELLKKARIELSDNLGTPINNAFFIYWHPFYCELEQMYDKVKNAKDFTEVVRRLTSFENW